MAAMGKTKVAMRAAGAATAAAPYVRAVLSDEELRDVLKDLAGSVNHLYSTATGDGLRKAVTDDRVREDIDRIVSSLQKSVRRVGEDLQPKRHWGRWFLIIGGAGAAAGATWFFLRGRGEQSSM